MVRSNPKQKKKKNWENNQTKNQNSTSMNIGRGEEGVEVNRNEWGVKLRRKEGGEFVASAVAQTERVLSGTRWDLFSSG